MATHNDNWNIIGHSNIVSFLQKNISNDKISHAYLFVGPEHIGKNTVMENFVASLLKTDYESLAKNIHPDIFTVKQEVDEKTEKLKKNISIEQIKEIQQNLQTTSFLGSYKIGIISEAEKMNESAANSLLKTLEEPPAKAILFLLASSTQRLPKTIISRCSVINFLPVAGNVILKHLLVKGLAAEEAAIISRLSQSRPGLALNYLQAPNFLAEYKKQAELFAAMLDKSLSDRFKIVEELTADENIDISEILNIWKAIIRDAQLAKNHCENLIVHDFIKKSIAKYISVRSNVDLWKIQKLLGEIQGYLNFNVNSRLVLENAIINL